MVATLATLAVVMLLCVPTITTTAVMLLWLGSFIQDRNTNARCDKIAAELKEHIDRDH